MQFLHVVARLFPEILAGRKTHTIRWREPRIVPGPMTYICEGTPEKRVVVEVTRCTDVPLAEAASLVGMEEVWPTPVMLASMREHYPEIELTDIVQVIEHLPPRGA